MKSSTIYFVLSFLCVVLMAACQKENKLIFFQVTLNEVVQPISLGEIQLRGNIFNTSNFEEIDRVGFIWSTDLNDIQINQISSTWIEATLESNGSFTANLPNLAINSVYYFRAFAERTEPGLGTRLVFSAEVETFSFQLRLSLSPDKQRSNNNMIIEAQISGLEDNNLSVNQYGFDLSTDLAFVENMNEYVVGTSKNDDGPFTDTLKNLNFNTHYYVRAWAEKTNGEKFFSPVDSFWIRDGWYQIPNLQIAPEVGLAKAFAVSNTDKGIVGLGSYADPTNVIPIGSNLLFELTITPDNNDIEWKTPYAAYDASNRNDCIGFLMDGALHAGLGEKDDQILLNQIRKYDFISNTWEYGSLFPVTLSSAVVFEINDKIYIGTGTTTFNDENLTNQFWEFNPDSTIQWRPVAPLPFQASFFDIPKNLGRYEAVSFVHEDNAYVGGGYVQGVGLVKDFWKFTPPIDDDEGSWELVTFFPGIPRYLAVSMVQQNRVYYGMGDSLYDGELTDWWEYIPSENYWVERTPLPADGRSDAVTMAIGPIGHERGFLGTGTIREINGLEITKRFLNDFWEYIPTQ